MDEIKRYRSAAEAFKAGLIRRQGAEPHLDAGPVHKPFNTKASAQELLRQLHKEMPSLTPPSDQVPDQVPALALAPAPAPISSTSSSWDTSPYAEPGLEDYYHEQVLTEKLGEKSNEQSWPSSYALTYHSAQLSQQRQQKQEQKQQKKQEQEQLRHEHLITSQQHTQQPTRDKQGSESQNTQTQSQLGCVHAPARATASSSAMCPMQEYCRRSLGSDPDLSPSMITQPRGPPASHNRQPSHLSISGQGQQSSVAVAADAPLPRNSRIAESPLAENKTAGRGPAPVPAQAQTLAQAPPRADTIRTKTEADSIKPAALALTLAPTATDKQVQEENDNDTAAGDFSDSDYEFIPAPTSSASDREYVVMGVDDDNEYESAIDGFEVLRAPQSIANGTSTAAPAHAPSPQGPATAPPPPPFTEEEIRLIARWNAYFKEGTLKDWQRFMWDLSRMGDFSSKTKCRKALRSVWVNIGQFLDAQESSTTLVRFFKSEYELALFTEGYKGEFPRRAMPPGSPLRAMLAHIKRHGVRGADVDDDDDEEE